MTEQERNLLAEVKRVNQTRQCGYTISGGGSKGSNFQRIAIEKRMAKLEAAGLVELGAHKGWWAVAEAADGVEQVKKEVG